MVRVAPDTPTFHSKPSEAEVQAQSRLVRPRILLIVVLTVLTLGVGVGLGVGLTRPSPSPPPPPMLPSLPPPLPPLVPGAAYRPAVTATFQLAGDGNGEEIRRDGRNDGDGDQRRWTIRRFDQFTSRCCAAWRTD